MRRYQFFQLLALCVALAGLFFFLGANVRSSKKNHLPNNQLLSSNTYFGPTSPIPGNPQLIKVEVQIRDSAELGGVTIQSVQFNGQQIPLKPADIFGNRGTGSFQMPPGIYKLRWTVQRDQSIWPRTVRHEEEVTIDPRDLWVQIAIEGESASIL